MRFSELLPIPVLVVDDQPANLLVMESLLADFSPPLAITTADSGARALRLCLQHEYAMVLLDVQMPDIDGYEVAEMLRANPQTSTLPIIFVTAGMNTEPQVFRGYEVGAVDYLSKPLDRRLLAGKIRVFGELYRQHYALKRNEERLENEVARRTQQLLQSESRLQDAQLLARSGHFQLENGQLQCSASLQRLLHLPETLSALEIRQAMGPVQWHGLLRGAAGLLHGLAANLQQELTYQLPSGEWLDLMLIMRCRRESAGSVLDGVLQDISSHKHTERALHALSEELEARVAERGRELEQALAKVAEAQHLQALTHLVAGIAHELNTPLGNIILAAGSQRAGLQDLLDLLAGEKVSRAMLRSQAELAQQATRLIEDAAGRAARLVSDFKAIALEDFRENACHFDLYCLAEDAYQILQEALSAAGVQWDNRIPRGIVMHSRPQALHHIICQLAENALQHAFAGVAAPCITLDAAVMPDQVAISIGDNGVGVDEATRQRMFEPFFTTRMGQGCSGLGLSRIHNLLKKALLGELTVHTGQKQGLRFELRCPINLVNPS